MAHQFKPGDLALIISSKCEENLGLIVTVVRIAGLNDFIELEPRYACYLTAGNIVVEGTLTAKLMPSNKRIRVNQGWFPPHKLIPLKGDVNVDVNRTKTKKPEHA